MAAGASSRMKKPSSINNLSKNQIKSADSKSKVLIEFGSEQKPFIKLFHFKYYRTLALKIFISFQLKKLVYFS